MAEEVVKITGQQLEAYFKAVRESLTQEQKDLVGGISIEIDTLKRLQETNAKREDLDNVNKKINDMMNSNESLFNDLKKYSESMDKIIAEQDRKTANTEKESFQEAWQGIVRKEMQAKANEIKEFGKNKNDKLSFEFKAIMTTAIGLPSAGGQVSYNAGKGIAPYANIHFRDLIPTVKSDNGSYVTFRETNTAQSAGIQTDGSAKANLTYTFVPSTETLKYIAGFATFSKQLMFNIPWLESTLPRMLLRDFYRKEDDYFYTKAAVAATGQSVAPALTAGTLAGADIEEVIRVIGKQRQNNYEASVGLIDWTEWAKLMITKPNDYGLPAGVLAGANGNITSVGMPLVGASWAQSDKILVFDDGYLERVEGESLRVEFSYENQDNFEKNLVTARVECFEELNILRPDALIYYDFGNS